jgi:hypothetical protein
MNRNQKSFLKKSKRIIREKKKSRSNLYRYKDIGLVSRILGSSSD